MAVRSCLCILSLVLAGGAAYAQGRAIDGGATGNSMAFSSSTQAVHGQIIHNPGTRVDRLYVEVQQLGVDSMPTRVPVSSDGSFDFDGQAGASYMVRITTLEGGVVTETMATPSGLGYLEVRLPEQTEARPPAGTVSAFELSHKVPGKALKEAREGDKRLRKHDIEGFIEHTEKAAAIDPDFIAARRNLGVLYLKGGQYEKAVGEFEAVLKRDPRNVTSYNGLSAAFIQLRRFPDAEQCARRAVSVDPSSDASHFFLGVSLDLQNKDESEALEHLAKVSNKMPKAHLIAAEILEKAGKTSETKGQLQAYLASGDQEVRSEVKSWLLSLK